MAKNEIMGSEYYKKINLHKGIDKKEEKEKSPKSYPMHKQFYTEGEYKFAKLNLIGYEWRRIYPIIDENDEIVTIVGKDTKTKNEKSESVIEKNRKKTFVFKSNESVADKAMAVMYVDRKEHYHELEILVLEDFLERNIEIIEKTKSILEKELKCKWNPGVKKKELATDLIDKIEEN